MEILGKVHEKMGKTIVIITHDSRVAGMANRQFSIVDGVLAQKAAQKRSLR